MGMSVGGGGGGLKSDINVTPLVDVLLVLLIIFMVIMPVTQMGYDVNVPPKKQTNQPPPLEDQLIVRMDRAGTVYINQEQVSPASLSVRLREILQTRRARVVFFAADGDLEYNRVVTVLDIVRKSGAENLGIVFEDLRVQ